MRRHATTSWCSRRPMRRCAASSPAPARRSSPAPRRPHPPRPRRRPLHPHRPPRRPDLPHLPPAQRAPRRSARLAPPSASSQTRLNAPPPPPPPLLLEVLGFVVTGAAATTMVLVVAWTVPSSSVSCTRTVKLPAAAGITVVLIVFEAEAKPLTMLPPSTSVHAALAIARPPASVLPAALSVIVWPAVAPEGETVICSCSGFEALAAATAAAASSM